MTDLLSKKIKELEELAKAELPDNVVSFKVEVTARGVSILTNQTTSESIKKRGVSIRNIKGQFIK